ncbi:hypothetical protein [Sphingomonas sp. CFBP 13706]|uniref:hypothetical protein n=1 Tax=Sphingomonas sp. CFBP 13706 TaxID=2775314 RepID=UPI001A7ED5E7|nr:hypothetical protein [Sphingomonas sp. CFBP 13706]
MPGLLFVIAHRPAIASVERPNPRSFDPALVARGANLARIGNCVSCQQAGGGRPYAGGYPIKTPFGTIYGSNITPHPDAGIGRWYSQPSGGWHRAVTQLDRLRGGWLRWRAPYRL